MSKAIKEVYKFPIPGDKTGVWAFIILLICLGTILMLLHFFEIFQEIPMFFGGFLFAVGILMIGVKRDVTIDMTTGTITSTKGFYFITRTEMYLKHDFDEIYIRRSAHKSVSNSASARDSTSYNIVLNGKGMITVDVFSDRELAQHWQYKLAKELGLRLGDERSEDGTTDKSRQVRSDQ